MIKNSRYKSNKKRKISILVISFAFVLLLLTSISYAYFSSVGLSSENTVSAGTLLINYEDDNLNTLMLDNISPIYDSEIKTKASKISFKVNSTGTSKAYVEISLTDIVMDEELSNLEFKWALYSGDEKISNGNFRNVTDSKQLLTNNIEINSGGNKSYQLYIWVSESDMDQTELMNKTFSAKVTINGSQEKQAELLSKVIKDNNPVVTTTPNFNNLATTDEGLIQGVDDDGDTYYFRGAVEDNYVKFEGLKWPNDSTFYIIGYNNTTKALKVVYNNNDMEAECNSNYSQYNYSSADDCKEKTHYYSHTTEDDMLFRIVRINGDGTIRLIADGSIGSSQFNSSWDGEQYVGYTYKNPVSYEEGERMNNTSTQDISPTTAYYYADSYTYDTTNGGYILTNPVQHTGEECLANKDLCVGKYTSVSTSTARSNYLYYVTNMASVQVTNTTTEQLEDKVRITQYVYKKKGNAVFDEASEEHDSKIKTYLENWYTTNMTDYDNLIANTRYCNDTTSTLNLTNGNTYYGSYNRIASSKNPSFICPNTDKVYGGEYDLKVGLITADEAAFAGGKAWTTNQKYYLYGSSTWYWTASPAYFNGSAYACGVYFYDNNVSYGGSVRPAVSLKADTLYKTGDGTIDNPYVVGA